MKPTLLDETTAEGAAKPVLVVVVAHSLFSITRDCLRSVAKHAGASVSRIILVDNGSGPRDKGRYASMCAGEEPEDLADGPLAAMAREGRLKLLRRESNADFGTACKEAVAWGAGEEPLILFLNNDAECKDDFVSKLVEGADRHPDGAIFGALLKFHGTCHVQHAGVAFDEKMIPYHVFLSWDEDSHEVGIEREWPAVTGGCMMVRRSAWDALGGFCDSLEPGQPIVLAGYPFEDVDLCVRAKAQGMATWMIPTARLEHRDSSTVSAILSGSPPEVQQAFVGGGKLKQLPKRQADWRPTLCAQDGAMHSWALGKGYEVKIQRAYIDNRVLVAIPVSDDYRWCLENAKAYLRLIDYPRTNLGVLWQTNNCGSDLIGSLREWGLAMAKYQAFENVMVPRSPVPGAKGHEVIVNCRNAAMTLALERGYDILAFLDVDVTPSTRALRRMVQAVDSGEWDVVTGVYCYKGSNGKPLLFRTKDGFDLMKYLVKLHTDQVEGREIGSLETTDENHMLSKVGPFRLAWEALSEGPGIVPVDGIPFGFSVMNRKAMEVPIVAGQKTSGTEDLSWCVSVRSLGLKIGALVDERAPHSEPGRIWNVADCPPEEIERVRRAKDAAGARKG